MTIQIQVPVMGESITEATVANWSKNVGDYVAADELIAELETDKINLEVNATSAGVITKIISEAGATVNVGDLMAEIDEAASAPANVAPANAAPTEPASVPVETMPQPSQVTGPVKTSDLANLSPAVRKLVEENNLNPAQISGSGKDGRLTKGDVLNFIKSGANNQPVSTPITVSTIETTNSGVEAEERVPMSRLRKTIAGRLKTAQNTAAMLTTYNEVDLSAIMELRKLYKEKFEKQHGIKLGFMSFFSKAVIEALKEYPALNAEIDGEELVYKKYYNIGVAVSTERGLIVPVLRNTDAMSFADIESGIRNFAIKGRDGKLMPDDMAGGTFTITNGGTFGSMMSMPILNYPQVGILGMHNIIERPVVVNGEIVIRPMMYLAMTYDHRIVDGSEAVRFLVKVKECLENPSRMLLGI